MRNHRHRHCAVIVTALLAWAACASVGAQQPTGAAPSARPPLAPFIDAANRLDGADLIRALRTGGYQLFMRHAFAGPPLPACPDEASLTADGQQQALQVGKALRDLRVPVSRVEASETCRTRDTARLLGLGPVTANPDLNPASIRPPSQEYARQFPYLLRTAPFDSNWLLVSHVQGSPDPSDRIQIAIAEVVVYQFRGSAKAIPVARIPLHGWAELLAIAATLTGP